jgi:hypothetical protein
MAVFGWYGKASGLVAEAEGFVKGATTLKDARPRMKLQLAREIEH